ncbi:MAG: DNA-3-methyladenine glycosylase [Microbacteriaceae bacterium]|nr:DNA-3-methyladenine glycosylase [Microbacteriaceae bacterium]
MSFDPDDGTCAWANSSPEMRAYHDAEWGVPSHDDRHLFEMLTLEGAQAGLSWSMVLKRRDGYSAAFHGFDLEKVASMTDARLEALRDDAGIVRNRAKIYSTRSNSAAILALGSFSDYLWDWVDGTPVVNHPHGMGDLSAHTELSDRLSKDLKKRGFSFVGTTIAYSLMQAVGMIDDHVVGCPAKGAR